MDDVGERFGGRVRPRVQARGLELAFTLGLNEGAAVPVLAVSAAPGHELEQQQPKSKRVHADRGVAPRGLLWAHVAQRAGRIEDPGQAVPAADFSLGREHVRGMAEVEQLHPRVPVDQHHVGGGDVSVNHSCPVAIGERPGQLSGDIDDPRDVDLTLDKEAVELVALESLGGQPRPSLPILEPARVHIADDIGRALQAPQVVRLVDQPLLSLGPAQVAGDEQLERDEATALPIFSEVDHGGPSFTELLPEHKTTLGELLSQGRKRCEAWIHFVDPSSRARTMAAEPVSLTW